MEQLHSVTVSGLAGTLSLTAPQWQAASIMPPLEGQSGAAVQLLAARRGLLQDRGEAGHRLAALRGVGDQAADEHHRAAGFHHLAAALHNLALARGADQLAVEGG